MVKSYNYLLFSVLIVSSLFFSAVLLAAEVTGKPPSFSFKGVTYVASPLAGASANSQTQLAITAPIANQEFQTICQNQNRQLNLTEIYAGDFNRISLWVNGTPKGTAIINNNQATFDGVECEAFSTSGSTVFRFYKQ